MLIVKPQEHGFAESYSILHLLVRSIHILKGNLLLSKCTFLNDNCTKKHQEKIFRAEFDHVAGYVHGLDAKVIFKLHITIDQRKFALHSLL